jgi:hypothetical protein
MIDGDPVVFAAQVMRLTDEELIAAWLNLALDAESSNWGQALRDEIMLRRLFLQAERSPETPQRSPSERSPGQPRGQPALGME